MLYLERFKPAFTLFSILCVSLIFSTSVRADFSLTPFIEMEKPVTLVLKESFGSDPYSLMASHDDIILVSGQLGAGDATGSRNIDILQYLDNEFVLVSKHQLGETLLAGQIVQILDLVHINNHWLALVEGDKGSAILSLEYVDGKLTTPHEKQVSHISHKPKLIKGSDNNLYLIDSHNALLVTHLTIDDDGFLSIYSSIDIGIAPNEPNYNDNFSVAFSQDVLYLTSNQDDDPAAFYKLSLSETGDFQGVTEFTMPSAQSAYHKAVVVGDLWFLSYHFWGFQVAKINGDSLEIIYESDQSTWYNDFVVKDNIVVAFDTFGRVDVYEINDNSIHFVSDYSTEGFIGNAGLVNDALVFTRAWNGIEAISLDDSLNLTHLDEFNESAQINDFALQGNELAVSALDNNIHFWSVDDEHPAEYMTSFEVEGVMGVAWDEQSMLVGSSGQLEHHLVENMKNNIDVGFTYEAIGTSGRDGQIINLKNGFLFQALDYLSFFSSSYEKTFEIQLEGTSGIFDLIQEPITLDNLLFVPINSPGQIIIYDTTDLYNIVELSRIGSFGEIVGNVAVLDTYLYVALSNGSEILIYDITDAADPQELRGLSLSEPVRGPISMHVYDQYLVVISDDARLFDVSDPKSPELIDININVTTNGIGKAYGNDIITVANHSGGVMNRSYINFAPTHADLALSINEDEQGELLLQPQDVEGDAVTFSLVGEIADGTIVIENNNNLIYKPEPNLSGEVYVQVRVSDEHGANTFFAIDIQITEINDAPTLEPYITDISVYSGQSQQVDLQALDVEDSSSELTYKTENSPTLGTVSFSKFGDMTYTANANAVGTESFSVSVSDTHGAKATATFNVSISAEPKESESKSGGGSLYLLNLFGLLFLVVWRKRIRK